MSPSFLGRVPLSGRHFPAAPWLERGTARFQHRPLGWPVSSWYLPLPKRRGIWRTTSQLPAKKKSQELRTPGPAPGQALDVFLGQPPVKGVTSGGRGFEFEPAHGNAPLNVADRGCGLKSLACDIVAWHDTARFQHRLARWPVSIRCLSSARRRSIRSASGQLPVKKKSQELRTPGPAPGQALDVLLGQLPVKGGSSGGPGFALALANAKAPLNAADQRFGLRRLACGIVAWYDTARIQYRLAGWPVSSRRLPVAKHRSTWPALRQLPAKQGPRCCASLDLRQGMPWACFQATSQAAQVPVINEVLGAYLPTARHCSRRSFIRNVPQASKARRLVRARLS